MQENQNSLSPFFTDKQNETFGDSLINNESEIFKNINMTFLTQPKPVRDPISLLDYNRTPKDTPELRPLPKGPFDRIKQLCIEHWEHKLVKQFVHVILAGYLNDYYENKDNIIRVVEEIILEKMNGLIEALCKCDKRKWMEILETDNKESLRHCENLQKKLREIQKKNTEPSYEDIDLICKEILQTQEFKIFISEKVREICQ